MTRSICSKRAKNFDSKPGSGRSMPGPIGMESCGGRRSASCLMTVHLPDQTRQTALRCEICIGLRATILPVVSCMMSESEQSSTSNRRSPRKRALFVSPRGETRTTSIRRPSPVWTVPRARSGFHRSRAGCNENPERGLHAWLPENILCSRTSVWANYPRQPAR